MLVLVRHAMPAIEPGVPADRWELGPQGRAAARALAATLPRVGVVVRGDEPKARQTAEAIVAVNGGTIRTDPRLRETRAPHAWRADFPDRARAYVGGAELPGWEPQAEVVA